MGLHSPNVIGMGPEGEGNHETSIAEYESQVRERIYALLESAEETEDIEYFIAQVLEECGTGIQTQEAVDDAAYAAELHLRTDTELTPDDVLFENFAIAMAARDGRPFLSEVDDNRPWKKAEAELEAYLHSVLSHEDPVEVNAFFQNNLRIHGNARDLATQGDAKKYIAELATYSNSTSFPIEQIHGMFHEFIIQWRFAQTCGYDFYELGYDEGRNVEAETVKSVRRMLMNQPASAQN